MAVSDEEEFLSIPTSVSHFDPGRIPRPPVLPMVATAPGRPELHVEIGSGSGLFAVRFGQHHPEKTLLAIEHTKSRFRKLQGRLTQHPHIQNVIPLHANAISILAHGLGRHTVSGLHVYYPNPYPKRSQRNKRWYAPSLAPLLSRCLMPEGYLVLATNLTWYADEAHESLCDHWDFHLHSREIIAPTALARTHFEKKYLERGDVCHNLIFEKTPLES